MKRCRAMLIAAMLMLLCFAVPRASAAGNAVSSAELYCTVNSEGDCLVSMTLNLHLEGAVGNLQFPLPGNATDVSLNGSSVFTSRSGDVLMADISRNITGSVGDFPLRFDYKLPKSVGVVKVGAERRLQLSLPMLSGFSYPVDKLSFIVTLPGAVTGYPSFTSIYQQTGFEANLDLVVSSNIITGASKTPLNDHDRVNMTLFVPTDMFPTISLYTREGNPELIPMIVLACIALVFWLVCLHNFPPVFARSATPPEGITAGELNCRLMLSGGVLSMMVFSWAQMGYLQIVADGKRVRLYKRMDMGNERSLFEIRIYQALFGKRTMVDCSGSGYAKLCAKTDAMVPGEKSMCRSFPGSRNIFRGILCAAQAVCGVNVAMNITSVGLLQIVFSVLFAAGGAASAWFMQDFARTLRCRYKTTIWVSLALAALWVVLGALGGQPWIPLGAVVVQLLCSFPVAYGGIRSELNRSDCAEIFGLKHHLQHLQPADVKRLLETDGDYFFRMAPFAIALGVGKPFARAFGRRKLEPPHYFITRVTGKRTAAEWMIMMERTVTAMDSRWQRTKTDRWSAIRFR